MASWYVRKGGSDNNGGSSASLTPDRSGADMATTNGSTQVTSASIAASAPDVGKGLNIAGTLYRIATVTNSTTIQLDRVYAGATGSSRSWKIGGALATIGKIPLTAAQIMQDGDTCYVGGGVYREANISFTMTSPTAETFFIGDVDGSHTGDPGDVQWTAWTTNDRTAPSVSSLCLPNTRKFLTFKNFLFISGNNGLLTISSGTTDCKWIACTFVASRIAATVAPINITVAAGVTANLLFDGCIEYARPSNSASGRLAGIVLNRHTVDYDAGIRFQNHVGVGSFYGIHVSSTGAGAGFGGGVVAQNCTFATPGYAMFAADANLSTTFPCKLYNSTVNGALGVSATTLGQVVEDYNILSVDTARNNVAVGAHSVSDGSYNLLPEVGQAFLYGRRARAFMAPGAGSASLAFGAQAGAPTVDVLGVPRPAGGGSASYAVGAFERGDTAVQETTTVDSGSSAIRLDGPGCQDFDLAVDAVPTTISIRNRHDSTYAGTLPQMLVRGSLEAGVPHATATAIQGADTWETLTIGPFTPTTPGVITVRLLSNDTNGAGKAFFDTFTVS